MIRPSPSELNAAVRLARDFVTAVGPTAVSWEMIGDPTAWPQPGERDSHDEWRAMNAGPRDADTSSAANPHKC